MARAGSLEKDVYFSAVPSQKSTVSLAGDNHRAAVVARWLGLSWPHPVALLPAKRTPPGLPTIHTQCAKTGGRAQHKRPNVTQRVCVRRKLRKLRRFINAGGSRGGRRRPDFWLNLNVAGCTEPICHQNNRRAGTYMTLATDGSLVS